MITGISILGGSYLVGALVGAAIIDEDEFDEDLREVADGDDYCRYCDDVAPYLFIPVVGPFVAMSQTPHDGGLLMLGMLQTVGLALTIGGIVRYKNTKRAAERYQYGRFQLRGGREVALDVGSGRMVGPRMTLRF